MNVQICGNSAVDFLQEIQKLRRTMAPVALAEHATGGNIESCEEAGDAVSFVVMRASLHLSGSHGQHRLRATERLNLRLLIHAQDQCMMGWVKIQPNNIPHLVDQQRISR